MNTFISRRMALKAGSALALGGALAACATTTTNGVTTVTVNVAEALAYVSGLAALATAFLAVPGVSAALGASMAAIDTAISEVNTAVPAINQAAGGSATFTFNTTSVPAFISSLESDSASVLTYAQAAVRALGTTIPANATNYYNGLIAVADALSAMFQIRSAASLRLRATAPVMSVQAALALVHIKAP